LSRAKQLDIQIAQHLILESAHFYLRQLGLHTNREIGRVLSEWETARQHKAEEMHVVQLGQAVKKESADQEIAEARTQLRSLVTTDIETQDLILQALRDRMQRQYQYSPQSVPFELFQNADDAVVELADVLPDGVLPSVNAGRFVVAWDGLRISMMHWGRAINQGGGDDTRSRGFDRDLQKMLVLSSSDKGASDGTVVTGKFGLGFKKCLLDNGQPARVEREARLQGAGRYLPASAGWRRGYGAQAPPGRVRRCEGSGGYYCRFADRSRRITPGREGREAIRGIGPYAPCFRAQNQAM